MKQQITLSAVFLKTKKLPLIMSAVLMMAFSNPVSAQNTSYDANTIPIGGADNCAFGVDALHSNNGEGNTAMGYGALAANTNGKENVAIGVKALGENSVGKENTANGFLSLRHNTIGYFNTASGGHSLYSNTRGYDNTANGNDALYSNTTGFYNTASGSYALFSNTTGNYNTASGLTALGSNTTGSNNTASGTYALISNTKGSRNTGLGYRADVSAGNLTNATALGNFAIVNTSNKVRFGNASVTVVEGPVNYTVSDGRFKTNVKEEDVKGLEFIKKLRPVVYNFDAKKLTAFWTKNMPDSLRQEYMKQDFSAATKIRQSGFIAQEVEKAANDVNYNFNGVHTPDNENDNYSLAYGQFVVPLVKGMQEQQKMIEEQQKMIEKLQKQVDELIKNNGTERKAGQSAMTEMMGASMEQNIPNPFTHETVVEFDLPQQVANATMIVYDMTGKQIKTLPISQRGASSITVTSDQLSAGIYIYSIVADGKLVSSKRMVVSAK